MLLMAYYYNITQRQIAFPKVYSHNTIFYKSTIALSSVPGDRSENIFNFITYIFFVQRCSLVIRNSVGSFPLNTYIHIYLIRPQLHIRYVVISPDIHYLRFGGAVLRVMFFFHLSCILFIELIYILRLFFILFFIFTNGCRRPRSI